MVEVGGGGGQEQAIKLQYWPRRVAFMVVYAERLYAPGFRNFLQVHGNPRECSVQCPGIAKLN